MNANTIFCYSSAFALGNFAYECALLATIKENIEGSRLILYFRRDLWYKAHIARMVPQIDQVISVGPDSRALFPIDYFDKYGRSGIRFENPRWAEIEGAKSDIMLTSAALEPTAIAGFPRKARFAVPEEEAGAARDALERLGLDTSRWFACLYWREGGYMSRRPNPFRDVTDSSPYLALARHIVEEQGGQVVRIGHPGVTPLPEMPGLIDLAQIDKSIWPQAFAVSRARYFISSNSGPVTLGPAFGTPTVITENTGLDGVWNHHDYSLTPKFVINGTAYRQEDAMQAGLLNTERLRQLAADPATDFAFHHCSSEDLRKAADLMLEETAYCQGLRPPGGTDNGVEERLGSITLPFKPVVPDGLYLPGI